MNLYSKLPTFRKRERKNRLYQRSCKYFVRKKEQVGLVNDLAGIDEAYSAHYLTASQVIIILIGILNYRLGLQFTFVSLYLPSFFAKADVFCCLKKYPAIAFIINKLNCEGVKGI